MSRNAAAQRALALAKAARALATAADALADAMQTADDGGPMPTPDNDTERANEIAKARALQAAKRFGIPKV